MASQKEWKFMKHKIRRRHIMEIHSLCLFPTNVSKGIYQHLLSHAFRTLKIEIQDEFPLIHTLGKRQRRVLTLIIK